MFRWLKSLFCKGKVPTLEVVSIPPPVEPETPVSPSNGETEKMVNSAENEGLPPKPLKPVLKKAQKKKKKKKKVLN